MDYTRYYGKFHPNTDAHYAAMTAALAKKWRKFLPERQEASVLDLGCGMGLGVSAIKHLGYDNVVGIDMSPQQCAIGRRRGLPLEYVEDSVAWLSNRPVGFDFILCTDVLEHVPKAQLISLLKASHAALRKGGRFLCTVPNGNASFAGRYRYGDFTHELSFTEHSLDFVLFASGFERIVINEDRERPKLPWLPRPAIMNWYLREVFRNLRRLEAVGEFGWERGRQIPVSLNLLAVATKD
jgi:SAM-dependent methyltransferase